MLVYDGVCVCMIVYDCVCWCMVVYACVCGCLALGGMYCGGIVEVVGVVVVGGGCVVVWTYA